MRTSNAGIRARDAASEIEQSGTLPTDLLELAYEEGLFKLFLPTSLGGRALSLPEAARVFQEMSTADGSFGWLTTIGSGGNLFLENMSETQAKELFTPAHAVIAGSGHASGDAVVERTGYRVSGEWHYCSGAPHASMFTANTKVWRDGCETDEVRACIFMPDQVDIIQDWDAFGLKGTGSHTIRVKEAFVPFDYTFSVTETQNTLGLPVHSFPFVQFSQVSFAAVCLGLGARFLEEAHLFAEDVKSRWSQQKMDRFMKELHEQQTRFDTVEQSFHETVERFWHMHLEDNLDEQKLETISSVCIECNDVATEATVRLFRLVGMQAVMESSPLNRAFRDLWTAGQHGFLQK